MLCIEEGRMSRLQQYPHVAGFRSDRRLWRRGLLRGKANEQMKKEKNCDRTPHGRGKISGPIVFTIPVSVFPSVGLGRIIAWRSRRNSDRNACPKFNWDSTYGTFAVEISSCQWLLAFPLGTRSAASQ